MAEYLISIQIETDQPEVLANIIDTLENVLPYMGDNVLITTKVVHD